MGAALDKSGSPSWKVYLEYWGSADKTTGRLGYDFKLEGPNGWVGYAGTAVIVDAQPTADGGYVYTFSGGYQPTDVTPDPGMPQAGSLQIQLHYWADGTSLYETDVALSGV